MEEIKQLLAKIEQDLEYFCKLFERFLDLIEMQKHAAHHTKTNLSGIRDLIMNNPMIQANPDAAQFLESIFGKLEG